MIKKLERENLQGIGRGEIAARLRTVLGMAKVFRFYGARM
jgi:hypothetical protein